MGKKIRKLLTSKEFSFNCKQNVILKKKSFLPPHTLSLLFIFTYHNQGEFIMGPSLRLFCLTHVQKLKEYWVLCTWTCTRIMHRVAKNKFYIFSRSIANKIVLFNFDALYENPTHSVRRREMLKIFLKFPLNFVFTILKKGGHRKRKRIHIFLIEKKDEKIWYRN